MNREKLSEEMRVLYVAMTRAKEKLIMLSTVKEFRPHSYKISRPAKWREKARAICGESSFQFSDWILSCTLSHTDGHQLQGTCYGETTASFCAILHSLGACMWYCLETGTCHRRNGRKQEAPVNRNLLQSLQEK